MFKTTDSGQNWTNITRNLPTRKSMGTLKHSMFHPQDPDTAYVLTPHRGVWKTVDGGASDWFECNDGLPSQATTYGSIHPNLPNDLCIVVMGAGVFKSTDGGANWIAKNSGIADPTAISCIARQPQDPNVLYAFTSDGFIYQSIDDAETWTCLNPGSSLTVNLRVIIIDPTDANLMYAGANGVDQFWKSTDGGYTWTLKNTGIVGFGSWIHGMTIDPTNPAIIYLNGYSGAIQKTTDRGETWFFAGTGIGQEINAMAIDFSNPDIIYAAGIGCVGGSGVWKSTDKGTTWNRMNNGFPSDRPYPVINTMVMHPTNPEILYVGGRPFGGPAPSIGVYKTTDGGDSWAESNNGLINMEIRALAIDPLNPDIMFAATAGGLFKSDDAGAQWDSTSLTDPLVRSLAIDPQNTDVVYAGMYGPTTVNKSTDGGETWESISVTDDDTTVICITLAPSNSNIIYAGTIGDDAGVYVYKSTDAGQIWQRKSNGLPQLHDPDSMRWHGPKGLNTLAIDPLNPNTVYAGIATEGGIYKTADGGENWEEMNNGYNGFPYTDILLIDPADRRTLHVGSYAGVWTYTTSDTLEPTPELKKAIAYANPARGNSVMFAYHLDSSADVTIRVYNLAKELVASITESKTAGDHGTRLDISEIPSGIYLYQITTEDAATGDIENWERQKLAIIR